MLVTGGSSGVGAAICRMLARPGVAILVHARRNRAGAAAVAQAVRDAGGAAEMAFGDLADPSVAAALVQAAVARFGGLDALVANAGFADRAPDRRAGRRDDGALGGVRSRAGSSGWRAPRSRI